MEKNNLFTLIPKVDEILGKEEIKRLLEIFPRKIVLNAIREEVNTLRNKIKDDASEEEVIYFIDNLADKIKERVKKDHSFKLKKVINASGVIIHTNLGRSPINEAVIGNITEVASNYSNLELDLDSGVRGSRYKHLEEIIADIIGSEAAMVVNNNAAAVMLILNTIAKNREVIVSRGELIEIGGSFRIPDVMEQSSATLVSVGTTNKTHIYDYERAINENTAALLKVHTSNYKILGFTSSVDSSELFLLKEKYNIPLIEDLGSGVLIDLSKYGLEYEPTVQDSIKKGVDVVSFSGDKLLGGPQAGIIVGKRKYIDDMKKNPLTRALRVDKFVIAALEATLRYYYDENLAIREIPTLNMLTASIEKIDEKAFRLEKLINENIDNKNIRYEIKDDFSEVGGGSLPLEKIPTKCLVLRVDNMSIQRFEDNLRKFYTPIIARVYKDSIYFDLRTIKDQEIPVIVAGIEFALDF
ncbi:L-seryl-tRNA(Sec) selenium transferase [Paratissierella segnis]|uniref:L-seryl-tRNA(Sec) selenium transferase n=1 Tax=Paratissierella segnis TaxID=2763679 RepID=A0A926ETW9_9FIRM|nr:L-seryl-tRNA(Sec) selenium transferase [Paratissierella segnis]MBC8588821.1 L-seryl-tRNA(Sec) selenium transferase [Paratissierella segnis]